MALFQTYTVGQSYRNLRKLRWWVKLATISGIVAWIAILASVAIFALASLRSHSLARGRLQAMALAYALLGILAWILRMVFGWLRERTLQSQSHEAE